MAAKQVDTVGLIRCARHDMKSGWRISRAMVDNAPKTIFWLRISTSAPESFTLGVVDSSFFRASVTNNAMERIHES